MWKLFGESKQNFDLDTLPQSRTLRHVDELIEAKILALIAKRIKFASEYGFIITHDIDSTTKKGVGKLSVAGIRIGSNVPFPLPLIIVKGESKEDIADLCKLMFQILDAVTSKYAKDVHRMVDAHLTDSTHHNKSFAAILSDMFNIET
ncbi:unnamed protein product [Lepeophtheirus salmonis]|uniref:(salmon louse) hypothetical protein n=1 Tax=Lepeophtheirus salmonis TaxID=72036 RepID=A0A7R8CTA3_LEPSM|nr:unnamed protein product [Lepeophtheirus salmonis]CAF2924595.1 unnamed protein product [Lepeophtheirus salmonis]